MKCPRCKTRPITNPKWGSYCRECNTEYARLRYKKRRDIILNQNKAHFFRTRTRNRNFISKYLDTHSCESCGENDKIVLEFVYIHPGKKHRTISYLLTHSASLKVLESELKERKVYCVNCHQRKRAIEFGWYKDLL